MSLHLAIFEEHSKQALLLKEMLASTDYRVTFHYSLRGEDWKSADIVLGDVDSLELPFRDLEKQCKNLGIPLIAISNFEIRHAHSLKKPVSIETLLAEIQKIKSEQKQLQKMTNKGDSGGLL